ncbi:MAG: cytochrome c [Gammaproteobacteria bacterium]|nr:cytochrome c [Gammaproteobacteria bacterium]
MQKLILSLAVVATLPIFWSAPGAAADRQNGRAMYETYCVGCHGEAGNSIDPTIPNFANGDRLFQMDSQLLESIRSGNQTMPAFRGLLSDREIRDVISYLRTL